MGPKIPGMDRFRAQSSNKVEEELESISSEISTIREKIDETRDRMTKLEEDYIHLVTRIDKIDTGLTRLILA